MSKIESFQITISDEEITDLRSRLARTRWPEAETPDDWSQGIPLSYTQEVVEYWQNSYNMQRLAERLNAYPNFKTEIDDLDIHFMHIRSSEASAKPLILSHGWPGSVLEFMNVIGPLTEPSKHGLSGSSAYHLVIPSLPGFGFSGKPTTTGWSVEKIARTWAKLMDRLGYDRYLAQGGDWGSPITVAVAAQDPEHCAGFHVNMIVVPPDANATDLTEAEIDALEGWQFYQDWDSGYSKQQSTRPQTLGYGLVDSPTGQAAWILEKFYAWMDCNGHPENVLSRDDLLDNVMVYWLNAAAASSGRLYWESFGRGGTAGPINVPMGGTVFPKDIFRTSRRFAEKVYTNMVHWSVKDSGGHFAALEQPQVFVGELNACFDRVTL